MIARIEDQPAPDFNVGRRLDRDLHEEPVARGGRQFECLFLLDPIPVREDLHIWKLVDAIEGGDIALRHQPQKKRMHLRASPVDLIEKENGKFLGLAQHCGGLDPRPPVVREIGMIEQITRHHVDSALDPLIGAADATRDGAQKRRLPDPDVAGEEHVSTREDRYHHQPDRARLADNDLPDAGFEIKRGGAPAAQHRSDGESIVHRHLLRSSFVINVFKERQRAAVRHIGEEGAQIPPDRGLVKPLVRVSGVRDIVRRIFGSFLGNLVDFVDKLAGLAEVRDAFGVARLHLALGRILFGDFGGVELWVVFAAGDLCRVAGLRLPAIAGRLAVGAVISGGGSSHAGGGESGEAERSGYASDLHESFPPLVVGSATLSGGFRFLLIGRYFLSAHMPGASSANFSPSL
ncbi:protein of unknown function [Methylocella tundrae]|uniref:Uncharacterized protein n=1 Tax=Methylocella tundrae TaxID=227605 RepID=A0A4U8Z0N3_METTU|nr:protein of unknown function [Methylocella tundrae]